MKQFLLVAVALVTLGGCASTETEPREWVVDEEKKVVPEGCYQLRERLGDKADC